MNTPEITPAMWRELYEDTRALLKLEEMFDLNLDYGIRREMRTLRERMKARLAEMAPAIAAADAANAANAQAEALVLEGGAV